MFRRSIGQVNWVVLIILGLGVAGLFISVASPASASFCGVPQCGNGVVETGEQCDDGNLADGDGCAADCAESFDMEVLAPVLTYTNGYPRAMARTDLNNDGIQDLLVTTFRSAFLYTYLLDGNGVLTLAGTYPLGSNTRDVKTGNLNGDHFPDVVTTDLDTDQLHIFFGNGDGTLTLASIFVPGDRLWLVDIGDIDNDGYDDLIVASMYTDGFKIYYGDGQGGFPRNDFIYTGGDPFAPLVMDFNHDGYNDLVLTVNTTPDTQTYLGSPTGLVPGQNFGFLAANTIAMDLNLDGYADLVSYGFVPDSTGALVPGMHILINQKDGTFVETEGVPSTIIGWVMDTADFNNDGIQDLVISSRANYVRLFLGNGQGSLEPEIQYPLPMSNDSTLVIDLNLDGLPDFLVSGYYNDAHREVWPVMNRNSYQFPRCGDSRIGRGENCDDGNRLNGDGCSAVCRIEASGDTEHDGLTDSEELLLGTNPSSPDTDLDCVMDGEEYCAGQDPLDPSDQPGCQAIIAPVGDWRLQVTLLEASAGLRSDVYLGEPEIELLIKNSLLNVGKVAKTKVLSGEEVILFIRVFGGAWGLGTYDHYSGSIFGRVTRIDAFTYRVNFEDLPVSRADWDFNDVVLLVEFLPEDPAVGVYLNSLDEFQVTRKVAPDSETIVTLTFDGYASVSLPAGCVPAETGLTLTAGLPEKYAQAASLDKRILGQFYKIKLNSGEEALLKGKTARLTLTYPDVDEDGFVDGSALLVEELRICWFNPRQSAWEPLPSQIDRTAKTITASTGEFSLFALGGVMPERLDLSGGGSGGPANHGVFGCAIGAPSGAGAANFLAVLLLALAPAGILRRLKR